MQAKQNKRLMHRKQYHAILENMFIELMFGKSISIIISITNLEGNNVWITYLYEKLISRNTKIRSYLGCFFTFHDLPVRTATLMNRICQNPLPSVWPKSLWIEISLSSLRNCSVQQFTITYIRDLHLGWLKVRACAKSVVTEC